MIHKMLRNLRSRVSQAVRDNAKVSYAQCGEDLIARFVFDMLKVSTPSYLDIGAHHPTFLSNTRAFYAAGSRGVNVEPDPTLIKAFADQRPGDINLNIGIAPSRGRLPFYVMTSRTLNTFSRQAAESAAVESNGKVAIEKVVEIRVLTINDVIDEHMRGPPDFLSLDVEGLDLDILKDLDYTRNRPKVICVETLTFAAALQGRKIAEIGVWLESQGYFLYADTYVNSIFVDRGCW